MPTGKLDRKNGVGFSQLHPLFILNRDWLSMFV